MKALLTQEGEGDRHAGVDEAGEHDEHAGHDLECPPVRQERVAESGGAIAHRRRGAAPGAALADQSPSSPSTSARPIGKNRLVACCNAMLIVG